MDTEVLGEDVCPVCRDAISANTARHTKCGHMYHIKCLNVYVRDANTCALLFTMAQGLVDYISSYTKTRAQSARLFLHHKLFLLTTSI